MVFLMVLMANACPCGSATSFFFVIVFIELCKYILIEVAEIYTITTRYFTLLQGCLCYWWLFKQTLSLKRFQICSKVPYLNRPSPRSCWTVCDYQNKSVSVFHAQFRSCYVSLVWSRWNKCTWSVQTEKEETAICYS